MDQPLSWTQLARASQGQFILLQCLNDSGLNWTSCSDDIDTNSLRDDLEAGSDESDVRWSDANLWERESTCEVSTGQAGISLRVTSGQRGCWHRLHNRCGPKVSLLLGLLCFQAMMEWGMKHLAGAEVWQHKERGVMRMWSSRLDRPKTEINREICVSRNFPEAKSQIKCWSLLNWTALPSRRSSCRDWCRFF